MDLGTVVKEYEDAVKSVKKGGTKGGAGRRQSKRGEAAVELAASGVQIRPKRRMPVGKVSGVAARHANIFGNGCDWSS